MSGRQAQEPSSSVATAPGKLYIAGEYAVVEHGHPAILVAVNRLLTARITEHDTTSTAAQLQPFGVDPVGRIHSAGHPEASVTWRRRAGRAVPDVEQPGAAFVLSVIHAVEELAQQQGRDLKIYDVNIESELDDASGRKYGLGSSAAVTVAMMKALTAFYGLELDPIQQYKLAFVSASRAQKVGSGGDLAASLFGGCIRFTAVDRQWVTNRLQDTALSDLIDMPWPGLSIARLRAFAPGSSLRLMVGWTGNPASTPSLVGHVQQQSAAEHERTYQDFLNGSDACVDALASALVRDDEQAVIARVREARKLLQNLSSFTGVTIETPALRALVEVAENHGAAAKSSGAGGGDCGIAIAGPSADCAAITRGWQEKSIVPLGLSVHAPQVELADWAGGTLVDMSDGIIGSARAEGNFSGRAGGSEDAGIGGIGSVGAIEVGSVGGIGGVAGVAGIADIAGVSRVRGVDGIGGASAGGAGDAFGINDIVSAAGAGIAGNRGAGIAGSGMSNMSANVSAGHVLGVNSQFPAAGANRKDDHVRLALAEHADTQRNAFDDIAFVHHSLGSVDVNDVDMATQVCGATWDVPFYINAMTGGSAKTGAINTSFARVAAATGLAMASGSQHAAIRDPKLEPTFTTIREHDPSGFVFANVGLSVSVEQALQAVEMIHADALQIHINAAQELVMPEGSRDFDAWPERIAAIVKASPVPVMVKEVGFGMSARTVRQLAELGVRTVDVSGRGGTDFARVENARRAGHEYGYMAGWGQSTALCLLASLPNKCNILNNDSASESSSNSGNVTTDANLPANGANKAVNKATGETNVTVLASGGVRNPLDVVKALALGAKAVGISGHFLQVLNASGEGGLIAEINSWKSQVRSLMALLGAKTVADLRRTDLLVTGKTAEEAHLLGVDLSVLAKRR
ncbi:phosphomevalonate kinase [Bifidobacterium sp. ESL0690]|uniref:phosphomevalonate kinase n=1 Tax=Bifidobacterium sp. ESL0690 TaxID=2983214 RepID=UPI0023F71237|nr:phosphomevalonate kinase [Bifidobacterium sp. ESL0690]WEV46943.1 phosphomevalonate kinase [Bifidobacterium sp. ESL0690]